MIGEPVGTHLIAGAVGRVGDIESARGGHRVGELDVGAVAAAVRRGSSRSPAPSRTPPPSTGRFGSRRWRAPRVAAGRMADEALPIGARHAGQGRRARRRRSCGWRFVVDCVVVSVVLLAEGGAAKLVGAASCCRGCRRPTAPRGPRPRRTARPSPPPAPPASGRSATSAPAPRVRSLRRVRRVPRPGRIRVDRRELPRAAAAGSAAGAR